MTGDSSGGTPIFDETAKLLGVLLWPAPFRHASGQPCYGCQSCLAEAYDMDSDPDDLPAEQKERNGKTDDSADE